MVEKISFTKLIEIAKSKGLTDADIKGLDYDKLYALISNTEIKTEGTVYNGFDSLASTSSTQAPFTGNVWGNLAASNTFDLGFTKTTHPTSPQTSKQPPQQSSMPVITPEMAKNLSIEQVKENTDKAFDLFMAQIDGQGYVSKTYDQIKDSLKTELSGTKIRKVIENENDGRNSLELANLDKLTKRDYYENNKQRLLEMFPGFEKMTEEQKSNIKERINSLSMENIKDFQHKIIMLPDKKDPQFAADTALVMSSFRETTESMVFVKEGGDTQKIQSQMKINQANKEMDSTELITFEEVYKWERGVSYNQKNIENVEAKKAILDYVSGAYPKYEALNSATEDLQKEYQMATMPKSAGFGVVIAGTEPNAAKREEKILNLYQDYFKGDSQNAQAFLQDMAKENKLDIQFQADESGKLAIQYGENLKTDSEKNQVLNTLLSSVSKNREAQLNKILNGKTYEQYQKDYADAYISAYGTRNAQELAHAFKEDQEGISANATGKLSMAGMGLMVVGGVGAFLIPGMQGVGGVMIAAGGKAAMGGMMAKTVLDVVNENTRKDGMSDEAAHAILKEALINAGSMVVGMGAGATGAKVGANLLANGSSKLVAVAAERGVDVTISMMGDIAMMGNMNFEGNIMGVVISTAVGLKAGKMVAHKYGDLPEAPEAKPQMVAQTRDGRQVTVNGTTPREPFFRMQEPEKTFGKKSEINPETNSINLNRAKETLLKNLNQSKEFSKEVIPKILDLVKNQEQIELLNSIMAKKDFPQEIDKDRFAFSLIIKTQNSSEATFAKELLNCENVKFENIFPILDTISKNDADMKFFIGLSQNKDLADATKLELANAAETDAKKQLVREMLKTNEYSMYRIKETLDEVKTEAQANAAINSVTKIDRLNQKDIDQYNNELETLVSRNLEGLDAVEHLSKEERVELIKELQKTKDTDVFMLFATENKPAIWTQTRIAELIKTDNNDVVRSYNFNPNTGEKEYKTAFVLNKNEVKKVIENNLELYQKRLNLNKNNTSDDIYTQLIREDGPLVQAPDDIMGLTLGYPKDNCIIFYLDEKTGANLDKQKMKDFLMSENSPYKDMSDEFKNNILKQIDLSQRRRNTDYYRANGDAGQIYPAVAFFPEVDEFNRMNISIRNTTNQLHQINNPITKIPDTTPIQKPEGTPKPEAQRISEQEPVAHIKAAADETPAIKLNAKSMKKMVDRFGSVTLEPNKKYEITEPLECSGLNIPEGTILTFGKNIKDAASLGNISLKGKGASLDAPDTVFKRITASDGTSFVNIKGANSLTVVEGTVTATGHVENVGIIRGKNANVTVGSADYADINHGTNSKITVLKGDVKEVKINAEDAEIIVNGTVDEAIFMALGGTIRAQKIEKSTLHRSTYPGEENDLKAIKYENGVETNLLDTEIRTPNNPSEASNLFVNKTITDMQSKLENSLTGIGISKESAEQLSKKIYKKQDAELVTDCIGDMIANDVPVECLTKIVASANSAKDIGLRAEIMDELTQNGLSHQEAASIASTTFAGKKDSDFYNEFETKMAVFDELKERKYSKKQMVEILSKSVSDLVDKDGQVVFPPKTKASGGPIILTTIINSKPKTEANVTNQQHPTPEINKPVVENKPNQNSAFKGFLNFFKPGSKEISEATSPQQLRKMTKGLKDTYRRPLLSDYCIENIDFKNPLELKKLNSLVNTKGKNGVCLFSSYDIEKLMTGMKMDDPLKLEALDIILKAKNDEGELLHGTDGVSYIMKNLNITRQEQMTSFSALMNAKKADGSPRIDKTSLSCMLDLIGKSDNEQLKLFEKVIQNKTFEEFNYANITSTVEKLNPNDFDKFEIYTKGVTRNKSRQIDAKKLIDEINKLNPLNSINKSSFEALMDAKGVGIFNETLTFDVIKVLFNNIDSAPKANNLKVVLEQHKKSNNIDTEQKANSLKAILKQHKKSEMSEYDIVEYATKIDFSNKESVEAFDFLISAKDEYSERPVFHRTQIIDLVNQKKSISELQKMIPQETVEPKEIASPELSAAEKEAFKLSIPDKTKKYTYQSQDAYIRAISDEVKTQRDAKIAEMILNSDIKFNYAGDLTSVISQMRSEPDEVLPLFQKLLNAKDKDGKTIFYTNSIRNALELNRTGKLKEFQDNGIFDAVTKGELGENFLHVGDHGKVSKLFLADFKKLKNNEPYVKEYSNKIAQAEILKQSELSEIVSIDGQAYVNEGEKLTKLNMTSQMYKKLFPPVERFDTYQGAVGDCFFVSIPAKAMENPYGRIELYKLFRQEGDDIYVSIPKYKEQYGEIKFTGAEIQLPPKTGYSFGLKKETGKNITGALGLQMLEQAYARVEDRWQPEAISVSEALKTNDIETLMSRLHNGGQQTDAIEALFGDKYDINHINVGEYYQAQIVLKNILANDANNPKKMFFFGTKSYCEEGCNPDYGLEGSHAQYIKSYDSQTEMITIGNPRQSSIDTEVPLSIFVKHCDDVIEITKK